MSLILPVKSMLSRHLYTHRFAYFLWLLFFIPALLWSVFEPAESAILFWNSLYSDPLNGFFIWCTRLGEGFGFVLALLVIGLSGTYRQLVGFVIAAVITLVLVWFFKHMVFDDAIRPIVFFERMGIELPNRHHYTLNRKHSFPSGHTTASFAYFFYVALTRTNRLEVFVAVLAGVLTAYSRVYLAQHFVVDTMAGSVLGVSIATVAYFFLVDKKPWASGFLDRSIIKRSHG